MTSPIQLHCEGLRCDIAPGLGGCIAGLWLDDVPVLRSSPAPALRSVRQAGSYPLVPFSNRVGHATLKWQGTVHALAQNFPAEPHAIHGVGWQRPWRVLEQSACFAMLAYEHRADASWPFAFDSSQTFRVGAHALELTLSLTNQAAAPAPVGLGWHPYFVKRGRSRIAFEAGGRWDMDAEKLPTRRHGDPGLDADCASLDIDHCFDGWSGVVQLRDECLQTRLSADLGCLVVFTNNTHDFVAIEPVSHVNNALQLLDAGAGRAEDLGVRVLQPGESMTAHMTIQTESVK